MIYDVTYKRLDLGVYFNDKIFTDNKGGGNYGVDD